MRNKLISAAAVLCLAVPASARTITSGTKQAAGKTAQAQPAAPVKKQAPDTEAAAVAVSSAMPLITPVEREIKIGDIEVYTPVTGITTAQETFDIFAPFDGRIEEVRVELFGFVKPKEIMARMVSTEMAALLDSTLDDEKKQTEKRWQDIYKYYDVRTDDQGVVTNVYVEPKSRVSKGDRLFTVAKKVIIIGKNTAPVYDKLAPDMTAEVTYVRNPDLKFQTRLLNSLSLKGSPVYNRLWLEVLDFSNGIKIGEQFTGQLFVGKSSGTRLVPRRQLIESGGRKYLLMEVETGLSTDAETEILKPGSHRLELQYPGKEKEDGKN